jgi:hypothetical protein
MEKNIQDQLDRVFEKKQQVEAAVARAKSAQQQREEAAVAKFKVVREELIKPAMLEFVSYLASRNCEAAISEKEERYSGYAPNQRLEDAVIQLQFSPRDGGADGRSVHSGQLPYFQVRLEKSTSKVYFMESTMWGNRGGHTGSSGHYDLHTLDQKTIEAAITKTIASVFG